MAYPLIRPPETLTTPVGEGVEMDLDGIPIVQELWRLRIKTTACCQDVGEATAGVRDQRAPSGTAQTRPAPTTADGPC